MTSCAHTSVFIVSDVALPLSSVSPDAGEGPLRAAAAKRLGLRERDIRDVSLVRRGVDARHRDDVHLVVTLQVELGASDAARVEGLHGVVPLGIRPDERLLAQPCARPFPNRPVVCGAGPAGLFAALTLAQAGWEPVVVERGADVDRRSRVVRRFIEGGELDIATNVQFGEGGAGTFSDGKLSTNTHDPRARSVLRAFVDAGAPADILISSRPHIGTDLLPDVVRSVRGRIEALGGTILFDTQLVGLTLASGGIVGVTLQSPSGVRGMACSHLVLACGHSARDTLLMLHESGVALERKAFSMGVRIEHLQSDIDRARFGRYAGHPVLGAADYHLSCHLPSGRGVYSFCMCPGGVVVPAASEEGGVVTNGMSCFARDGANANSGFLVDVRPDDLPGEDVLAGFAFQRRWERAAFEAGGCTYAAPAMLLGDLLTGRETRDADGASNPVRPSYGRGVRWGSLDGCLPGFVLDSLREAAPLLDRKLHGFAAPQAVLTGVETRSSSPVRMVRDRATCASVSLPGLYPCGEGAGYAGGITSAAVDGIRVAQSILGQS